MKKIAVVVLLSLNACIVAPVQKTKLPVIGEREPIVLSREGVGNLVTITPRGRWIWHRTPKEVVSNLAEALGQMGAQMFAQREQLQKCQIDKLAANAAKNFDPSAVRKSSEAATVPASAPAPEAAK